jgi:iron complex outermembrane receptor protein
VLRKIETGVSPWRQTTRADTGDSSVIKRLLIGTAAGALGAAFAAGAYAQAANDTELEQVVVTAQRREQSAQDVGIALSVISGDQLAARGVTNVNQLQYQTPSLEVARLRRRPAAVPPARRRLRRLRHQQHPHRRRLCRRSRLSGAGRHPGRALRHRPGRSAARPAGHALWPQHHRRRDQLHHPPTDRPAVGRDHRRIWPLRQRQGEGFVSGPISDTLKGRLSAVTEQGGAWQRNRVTGEKLGDADRSAVRGQLDWTPTDKVDVLLNAHYGRDKSDGQGLYLLNVPGQVGDTKYNATGWGFSSAFAARAGVSTPIPSPRATTSRAALRSPPISTWASPS